MHGDNQYDASKIPDMLDEIINNDMDMVLGSRILGGKTLVGGMPRYKYFGNHLLNFIQNIAYNMNLSDYATGYKAYRANSLKKFRIMTIEMILFLMNKLILNLFILDIKYLKLGFLLDILMKPHRSVC